MGKYKIVVLYACRGCGMMWPALFTTCSNCRTKNK